MARAAAVVPTSWVVLISTSSFRIVRASWRSALGGSGPDCAPHTETETANRAETFRAMRPADLMCFPTRSRSGGEHDFDALVALAFVANARDLDATDFRDVAY